MTSDIVSDFEDAVYNGRLMIPKCDKCHKIVWPLAELCSDCFGTVSLYEQNSIKGHIIECSEYKGFPSDRYDGGFFCLVEITDEIRVIAHMQQTDRVPKPGASVTLRSCGINTTDATFFFDVELRDV